MNKENQECPHGCPWPHQKDHWHYTKKTHLCEADEVDQMRAIAFKRIKENRNELRKS